jgi:hypothetical protein
MIAHISFFLHKATIDRQIASYIQWRKQRWPHGDPGHYRQILYDLFKSADCYKHTDLTPPLIDRFLDGFDSIYMRRQASKIIKRFLVRCKIDDSKSLTYSEYMAKKEIPPEVKEYFANFGRLGQQKMRAKYSKEEISEMRRAAGKKGQASLRKLTVDN